jgi:hypothetical protein
VIHVLGKTRGIFQRRERAHRIQLRDILLSILLYMLQEHDSRNALVDVIRARRIARYVRSAEPCKARALPRHNAMAHVPRRNSGAFCNHQ